MDHLSTFFNEQIMNKQPFKNWLHHQETISLLLIIFTFVVILLGILIRKYTTSLQSNNNNNKNNNNNSINNDDDRIHVKIQYCDSCGFGERAEKSKTMLYDEFPSTEIRVTLEPDKDVTGSFEVFVDNQLVHSKKTRNDGFLYNNAKQEIIVLDAITAARERRKNVHVKNNESR